MGPAERQGHGATHEDQRRLTWHRDRGLNRPPRRPPRWPPGGRMSFREITMQDVSEVLRRWQAGQSGRRIAREMGIDRKTVGRYIDEAKAGGLVAATTVTEAVARTVGAGVQTRPLPPPSQQWRALAARRE